MGEDESVSIKISNQMKINYNVASSFPYHPDDNCQVAIHEDGVSYLVPPVRSSDLPPQSADPHPIYPLRMFVDFIIFW
jgi:hypothetical protein